jgi:large exoprotein involved in heme utilization and adhesion
VKSQAASGVLASTDVNSTGNGGNVFIFSKQVNLRDRGVITVSSQGFGVAGNIEISAETINLQNQGAITAETRDFQIKKHPKFSCGMGVLTRPIFRAGRMPTPQDG